MLIRVLYKMRDSLKIHKKVKNQKISSQILQSNAFYKHPTFICLHKSKKR